MNTRRRLAEGIGSWLQFEFNCGRGHLFAEKYLAFPIGQVLSSIYGHSVYAEVDHPVLKEATSGPGKRPKLDFAVIKDDKISLAVELKWAGPTPLKVSDIIWDLIRLELVAHYHGAKAIFVLAGQRRRLRELFDSAVFLGRLPNGAVRPVLKIGEFRSMGFRLDTPPPFRRKMLQTLLAPYQGLEIPTRLVSGVPSLFPAETRMGGFQAYVWEITPQKPIRTSFVPAEHKFYRTVLDASS
jgi:hypothetical protein